MTEWTPEQHERAKRLFESRGLWKAALAEIERLKAENAALKMGLELNREECQHWAGQYADLKAENERLKRDLMREKLENVDIL